MGSVTSLHEWQQRAHSHPNRPISAPREVEKPISGGVPSDVVDQRVAEECRRAVLRLLGRSDKTIAEVRRSLGRRDFREDVVDTVIAEVVSEGLCDDRAIAERVVERATRESAKGAKGVERALVARGVPDAVVAEVLAAYEFDEDTAAKRAASDYRRSHPGVGGEALRRRLGGYLQRRGFQSDSIRRAMDDGPSDA